MLDYPADEGGWHLSDAVGKALMMGDLTQDALVVDADEASLAARNDVAAGEPLHSWLQRVLILCVVGTCGSRLTRPIGW